MANFLYYVEAQEKEGGAYWEFLKMDDDQLYETIGLDDVVIVDSDDALLVAAKGKIQDVKKVAEEIKGRGC